MKILFTLLIFSFTFSIANSQSPDRQWYVLNGKGWDGSNHRSVQGSNHIVYFGIKDPSFSCNAPLADDDLFIIFSDHSHYNSRYDNARDYRNPFSNQKIWKYNPNGEFSIAPDQQYNSNGQIEYVYWTNKYEDDPPPSSVNLQTGNENIQNKFPVGDYTPQNLSTNHDIIPGKDVVLIIRNSAVKEKYTIKIELLDTKGKQISVNSIFTKSDIFQNNFFLSQSASTATLRNNTIEINGNNTEGFTYLNLRARENLSINPSRAKNKVKFSIDDPDDPFSITEDVRKSHDPNFIALRDSCVFDNAGKYLIYEGRFQNNGNALVDSPRIEFRLSSDLQSKKPCINNVFFASNQTENYNVTTVQNEGVYFKTICYFNDKGLKFCRLESVESTPLKFNESTVTFTICVGPIPNNMNISQINDTIYDAKVYFDGVAHDMAYSNNLDIQIHALKDSAVYFKPIPITENCDCNGCEKGAIKCDGSWIKCNVLDLPMIYKILFLVILFPIIYAVAGGIIRARNRRKKEDDD